MSKLIFALVKLTVGTVSFKAGFFGGMFGLFMVAWSILDILELSGIVT